MTKIKGQLLIFGLLAAITMQTSCTSVSSDGVSSRRLYQPPRLRLQAGVPVQTLDGIYTPQVQEEWAAQWKLEEYESQNLQLAEALRKLQAERDLK